MAKRTYKEAIDRLADRVPYGHLLASEDDAIGFLDGASDEIDRLRLLSERNDVQWMPDHWDPVVFTNGPVSRTKK